MSSAANPQRTIDAIHEFLCSCLHSAKKEDSLMICGWVWVLKMYQCTSEASPNLWRLFRMSTSFSLEPRSPAPTRSPWTRERCSLKRLRYLIWVSFAWYSSKVQKAILQWCTHKPLCVPSSPVKLLSVCFQVGEIAKIMKAYINMIVKKRCSVKSVSSFGSNWIRWLDDDSEDFRAFGDTETP